MKHICRKILIILAVFCAAGAASADEPILVIEPQGHSSIIQDVIFTPDGKMIANSSAGDYVNPKKVFSKLNEIVPDTSPWR